MKKENLFKKRLTAEPHPDGFVVCVYGEPTGQVYPTEKRALEEIEKIKLKQAAKKSKIQK